MPGWHDDEFGAITVRRSRLARSITLSVAPNGTVRISAPTMAPLFLLKRFLAQSREAIRKNLQDNYTNNYYDGMQIGKSHSITLREGELAAALHGRQIVAHIPSYLTIDDPVVQKLLREKVIAALRREAKSYLPRRLQFLANKFGFSYTKVRFSHTSSRWGSCSSTGTISLNIALMKLPFELIDYVLVHELSHTRQMNHGQNFWDLVAQGDPDYKKHRKLLKTHSPIC